MDEACVGSIVVGDILLRPLDMPPWFTASQSDGKVIGLLAGLRHGAADATDSPHQMTPWGFPSASPRPQDT